MKNSHRYHLLAINFSKTPYAEKDSDDIPQLPNYFFFIHLCIPFLSQFHYHALSPPARFPHLPRSPTDPTQTHTNSVKRPQLSLFIYCSSSPEGLNPVPLKLNCS